MAAAAVRSLGSESGAAGLVVVLLDTLLVHDGSFGRCFRQGGSRRASKLAPGVAVDMIFPLPLMHVKLPARGRARERESSSAHRGS